MGFVNPWWFVGELQGVREFVQGMPYECIPLAN